MARKQSMSPEALCHGPRGKQRIKREKVPYRVPCKTSGKASRGESKGSLREPRQEQEAEHEAEDHFVPNEAFRFEDAVQTSLPEAKGPRKRALLDELIEEKRKLMHVIQNPPLQEEDTELLSDSEAEPDQEESPTMPVDPTRTEISTFHELSLSRPIQRGIASLGFVKPTPIQAAAIPVALSGKDICGGAVTGSGKTAAFVIPILERLLYRNRSVRSTRALILLPTRELALQCFQVTQSLSAFTDIQTCLLAGGLSYKGQEGDLRKRPDILVATPGRLIDHLKNSASFSLESIEILVLDEADRMLEVGFEEELREIVSACPSQRQTMLFSATLTEDLQDLVRLSLSKPLRLFVDSSQAMASRLTQEFIRIRSSHHESTRLAMILALVTHYYRHRVIVFFPSKAETHRARVLFGLHGLQAAELHGNLNQTQRLEALDQFKRGEVDFLLATDLAARGLDIAGVETVVNYSLPLDYRQYLHRIGRTARAGKSGRSVSLVGEADRKILKLAIKNSRDLVKQRLLHPDLMNSFQGSIGAFEGAVQDILGREQEQKALSLAERDLAKAQNMIDHAQEIYSRPKKTYIQKSTRSK